MLHDSTLIYDGLCNERALLRSELVRLCGMIMLWYMMDLAEYSCSCFSEIMALLCELFALYMMLYMYDALFDNWQWPRSPTLVSVGLFV